MIVGRINTAQSSEPFVVPAPIGGLNGRDPLASMAPTDAYLLDNLFPNTASVDSRKGCEKHNADDVLDGPVQTLDVFAGADGDQMLAWAGDSIYDVSLTTPSVLETGMVSALAINTMFSNASDNSQHLISVTGYDTPKHYDGGTISDLTMTGITTPADLNYVFSFKERLYFSAREMLGFYYLPVGQIQGALSYFDLAQVANRGGYLLAIASFSEDGGDGPNDYIVFITSKGECVVYAGYDPSDANNWKLVGRFYAGTPIGQRCAINYNAELILLTLEGAIPFSLIRKAGKAGEGVSQAISGAITSKLGKFLSVLNSNSNVPGWQGVQYSRAGWLLLNVPATSSINGAYYHYIMNTTTNAWCRFTNWNGLSFCIFNDRLYFGRYDGYIMLADEGRSDDGEDILCDAKQAYNYFADERGVGPLQKHFQWATLIVKCDGTPPISGKFNVDFVEEQPQYLAILTETDGSEWDVDDWDLGTWGTDGVTQRVIITLNKGGFVGALWLRAPLNGLTLEWYATQYVLQRTKGLLI
jgi:hypothetical protein